MSVHDLIVATAVAVTVAMVLAIAVIWSGER